MGWEVHLPGHDSEDAPQFLGRGDSRDAPTLEQNSVTGAATPSRQRTKGEKNGEINEAGQPPKNKDAKYRQNKKREQLGVEQERDNLKVENRELKCVIERLGSDKVRLEKEVLEFKAYAWKLQSEKENVEKRCYQRELEIANAKLQTHKEVLEACLKPSPNVPVHESAKTSCFVQSMDWSHGGNVLGDVQVSNDDERRGQLMNLPSIDENLNLIDRTNPIPHFSLQQGTTDVGPLQDSNWHQGTPELLAPYVETNPGHQLPNEVAKTSRELSKSSRAKLGDLAKQKDELVDLIKEKLNIEKRAWEMVSADERIENSLRHLEKEMEELKSHKDAWITEVQRLGDIVKQITEYLFPRSASSS